MTSSIPCHMARFLLGVYQLALEASAVLGQFIPAEYLYMMLAFATKQSDESKARKINLQHKAFKKLCKLFWSEIFLTCVLHNSKNMPLTLNS